MRSTLRLAMLLFIIAAIITSCKKAVPKQAKYIPKEASVVFSINPKNLQDKLENSKFNMDSLFKNFADTASASTTGIKSWDDVKNSGIDLSSNFFVFVQQRGSIMSGSSTATGIIAALKDAAAFETFLKKHKQNVAIKKDKNYTYAALNDGFVAGWSSDIIILSNVTKANFSQGSFNKGEGGNEAQLQLTTLFEQGEDKSVASVPEFRDLMAQKADMLFFTNSSSTLSTIPFLGMTKAGDLLKDAYTAGIVNFEEGKVNMNSKTYTGKDLTDILKKYSGPTVDMDMVTCYPSSKINGFAAFSFNPQIIGEIIRYIGFEGQANQYLQQMGFTMDDVLKAFKGDFAVVFSDFNMTSKANAEAPEIKIQTPSAKLIINAKIGNKAAYDKVVAALAKNGLMVKQGDQYILKELVNDEDGFTMNADGKNLIFATDKNLLQQYKAGGKANIAGDVKDKAKGNATAFYVDVASLLNAVPRDTAASSLTNSMMDDARNTFKDITATVENFDGRSIKSVFELRTVNDKENSLVTLVRYFSAVIQKTKSRGVMNGVHIEDVPMDEMQSDSMQQTEPTPPLPPAEEK